ncbi:hypothetical protein DL96DRAFT_119760 [Flagelloscypha sp. PMI_526]|nr:hypothetical protein DL96DRAFT_119760 [Flagelloscypha sp. PMI_526]
MRFAVITSIFITALPFAFAAPTGVVDKRVVNCVVAPCPGDEFEIKPVCIQAPCNFGGNFPFNKTEDKPEQDENSPSQPLREPEIKPVCFQEPCNFLGNFPFNQTEDALEKDGEGLICAGGSCTFDEGFGIPEIYESNL